MGQIQHAVVVVQHIGHQTHGAMAALVVHQLAHQKQAQPAAFEFGTYDDPKLGLFVVRVTQSTRHAQRLRVTLRVRSHCYKCHFSGVVNLHQPREFTALHGALAVKHPHANVLRAQRL